MDKPNYLFLPPDFIHREEFHASLNYDSLTTVVNTSPFLTIKEKELRAYTWRLLIFKNLPDETFYYSYGKSLCRRRDRKDILNNIVQFCSRVRGIITTIFQDEIEKSLLYLEGMSDISETFIDNTFFDELKLKYNLSFKNTVEFKTDPKLPCTLIYEL